MLDVTRLASRLPCAAFTGVDRVERAYLDFVIARQAPVWGLVHTKLGYLLLDRAGLREFVALCAGTRRFAKPGLVSRLTWPKAPDRARTETTLRAIACARTARFGLRRMLRRHVPAGAWYLNTGHSNLTHRTLAGCRAAGLPIAVLIHDTLPLDHPEFMRPDTIPRFQRRIAAVSRHADLVIHPTQASRSMAEAHLTGLGRCPAGLAAPIAVDLVPPDPLALPAALARLDPVFVCVGTIEPRKNHALLLDVWAALAKDLAPEAMPHLVFAGARGWQSPEFFARMEGDPQYGRTIHEAPGLSDPAVWALYQRSRALLFPSFAEGTGLPPLEAAALGCPVILADLAVYRETLGSLPVYLSPVDMYPWLQIIKQNLAGSWPKAPMPPYAAPDWQNHFAIVFPDG